MIIYFDKFKVASQLGQPGGKKTGEVREFNNTGENQRSLIKPWKVNKFLLKPVNFNAILQLTT